MRRLLPIPLLALLVACGGGDPPVFDPAVAIDPLDATSWRLGRIDDREVPRSVTITAVCRDGRISGRAGCNRYFAAYEPGEGTLAVGAVGTTKMTCPPEVMTWDRESTSLLPRVVRFRRDGDRLVRETQDGTRLRFVPRPEGS